MISFGSDNHAPIDPRILRAVSEANHGWSEAYGADELTARAERALGDAFGPTARSFLVFNGTGGNVVGLSSLLFPHEAVICPESAHLNNDECGALERFCGSKVITVASSDGKLRPAQVEPLLTHPGDAHRAQPRVISISQVTELGTLYSKDEIRDLADLARRRGLFLHVDGARFSNAVAALGVSLREASADLGVDILTFGGTKNGMLFGEAVVVFERSEALRAATARLPFARKQGMQLASKMRFLAAQFVAYLEKDLWRENALHANSLARRLEDGLRGIPGVEVALPVESNAVFAYMPDPLVEALRPLFFFHYWDRSRSLVRLMTSFRTEPEEIDAFTSAVRELAGRRASRK